MNTNLAMSDNIEMTRAPSAPMHEERDEMAFVNEYIPEADIEKYQIKEIDEKFHKGHYKPHWTIDRERDIYLRYMHNEREEHSNRHTYYFFWKKAPLLVTVDIDGGGVMNGKQWRHYKLWRLDIPETLRPYVAEIVADLKAAFVTYREAGVLSDSTDHTATFDF